MTFDKLITYACLLNALAGFVDFFLLLYLMDELLPVFDPKFKVNVNKWSWLSWSRRLARTGYYASHVAGPKMKHDFVKTAVGYDFKSKVSKRIYRLCLVHVVCVFIFIFIMFPVGIFLTVKDFF